MLYNKSILLIVSGGIAAYKSAELIRQLRQLGAHVRCILTNAGSQFITPLTLASLSAEKVYTDLFSLTDESDMGHIKLGRETDLILVAPATANIIARMASGIADDLATTTILASEKPILIAPAMNKVMWDNPSTQRNISYLQNDSVNIIGPDQGDLACGEVGHGRMAAAEDIIKKINLILEVKKPLAGLRALVTSGPTHEPLDPVRYISNNSSGKQGHAIAVAAASFGADVTLISGPTALKAPEGVSTINVKTAEEMLNACISKLPVDFAICCAAVADWRPAKVADQKIKKSPSDGNNNSTLSIKMLENQDILGRLAQSPLGKRPKLLVGFAAETNNVIEEASKKLTQKKCDWIVANDVSKEADTFGSDNNKVTILKVDGSGVVQHDSWPKSTKVEIAEQLIKNISMTFASQSKNDK